MRNKILSLPLLIALGLSSGQAAAVGLGQIEVQSRLNQPLVAEIRLLQVAPGELDRMHVRLASPEAFARVGLDRPSAMTANLQFALDTNARGEPVIRVTTPTRVNDPFLSFLLEIEWGAGRMVREYNVLLDPPYMAPATRVQVAPATTAPPAPVQQAPAVAAPSPPVAAPPAPAAGESAAAMPAAPAPAPSASPAPASVPAAAVASTAPVGAGGTFTVAAGQTLSGIANRERDADVSVNQMMIALLRANPEAFIDGNINLLRAGAVMRLPSRDEVTALRAAEANAIVSEQIATWNARRAPVPQPAQTARQEPAATPAASASEARLAIVPPTGEGGRSGAQSGAAAGGEGTQLRVELTQAEEEIAARDAEIEEMRSRMEELEALAESQSRMIELRNQEMQDMQRRLREAREGGAEAGAAAQEQAPAASRPWYLQPLSLGGLVLLVVGGLVWLFTRRRREDASSGGRAGPLAASIEAARTSPQKPAPVMAQPAEDEVPGDASETVEHDDDASTVEPLAAAESDGWDAPVHDPALEPETVSDVDVDTGVDVDPAGALAGPESEPQEPVLQAVPDDASMDDWDLAPEADAQPVVEAGTGSGDGFDLEDGDGDSVGTKLELARAYIDIGDLDGARSMLEEVRDEGTPAQQAQARELLDGLR